MATGIDTSLLVAAEVLSHPDHSRARAKLQSVTQAGEQLALAPQVLAEFVHIVTDPRRFTAPLDMAAALPREHRGTHRKSRVAFPMMRARAFSSLG